jgi:ABC-type phosphate transport system auxiliary subunit
MAGTAKDGSTVLFRALVNKIEGMEKLVAEIISPNQQVQMGLLSEVIEGMKEIRRDTTEIKQDTAEIKEDMQKVLNDLELILENQAIEFAQLEDFRNELDGQINTLNLKMNELEVAGQFDQISQIQNTLEGLRREVEEQNQKIDLRLDAIGLNLGKAIDFIRPNEENVEEKVGSSVWARIKNQWQDFKDDLKSDNKEIAKEKLKEIIKSAGKEFGKKSLKILVSWMTAGVIQLPI